MGIDVRKAGQLAAGLESFEDDCAAAVEDVANATASPNKIGIRNFFMDFPSWNILTSIKKDAAMHETAVALVKSCRLNSR